MKIILSVTLMDNGTPVPDSTREVAFTGPPSEALYYATGDRICGGRYRVTGRTWDAGKLTIRVVEQVVAS